MASVTCFAGAGANDASAGDVAWTSTNAITAEDTTGAEASGLGIKNNLTQFLVSSQHGFNLSTNAVIDGIEVTLLWFIGGSGTPSAADDTARLVKAGTQVGSNLASPTIHSSGGSGIVTYGGPTELWGTTWTASDINNVNFGFAYAAERVSGTVSLKIDYIKITVYYHEASTPVALALTSSSTSSVTSPFRTAWQTALTTLGTGSALVEALTAPIVSIIPYDAFDDGEIDTDLWSPWTSGAGNYVEDNGIFSVSVSANQAGYAGLNANATLNLTGSRVWVQVNQVLNAGSSETDLWLYLDANNQVGVQITGTVIQAYRNVDGSQSWTDGIAYDPAQHRYIGFSEADGDLLWEWSHDGSSWSTLRSEPAPFDLTHLEFRLFAGVWDTSNSHPGTAIFDNANLVPTLVALSGTVAGASQMLGSLGSWTQLLATSQSASSAEMALQSPWRSSMSVMSSSQVTGLVRAKIGLSVDVSSLSQTEAALSAALLLALTSSPLSQAAIDLLSPALLALTSTGTGHVEAAASAWALLLFTASGSGAMAIDGFVVPPAWPGIKVLMDWYLLAQEALSQRLSTPLSVSPEHSRLQPTTLIQMEIDQVSPLIKGAKILITGRFRDHSGKLIDPDAVRFRWTRPDDSTGLYTYGTNDELERAGRGVYRVALSLDQEGIWKTRFESTGDGQGAQELELAVTSEF